LDLKKRSLIRAVFSSKKSKYVASISRLKETMFLTENRIRDAERKLGILGLSVNR